MSEDLGTEDSDRGATSPAPTRSPRISRADVFNAADALLLEGHKPTIDRVRMRIGRGSPNTIQEHLDLWWTQLGSRLRDIPGREFPELPERVAVSLQKLWNVALDSAHELLGEKVSTREQSLAAREATVAAHQQKLLEQEQATAARAAALEESLGLARDQLLAANQRADRLEASLQGREVECERLQKRAEVLDADARELRHKLEALTTSHRAERTKLEERHAATDARWLLEIDRARQSVLDTAKDHEQQIKELRTQISRSHAEREELKQELKAARLETRTLMTDRAQLEKQLATATKARVPRSAPPKPSPQRGAKPSPEGRRR